MNSISNSLGGRTSNYLLPNITYQANITRKQFTHGVGAAAQTGNNIACIGRNTVGLGNWREPALNFRMQRNSQSENTQTGSTSRTSYQFPSNRPFSVSGFAGAYFPFYRMGQLCPESGVFSSRVPVSVDGPVSRPGSNFIRHATEWSNTAATMGNASITTITGFDYIEVGKNLQTLHYARRAFHLANLRGAPNSIASLTDNDIAMAVFINKWTINSQRFSVMGTEFQEEHFDPYFEHNPVRERSEWTGHYAFVRSGHDIIEMIPQAIAQVAQTHLLIETFFCERNINSMINEISGMFDSEIDTEFLRNAITEIGRFEKEFHYRALEGYFDFTSREIANYIYGLFVPGFNADTAADEPNFTEFKQAARDLLENMFAEAVFSFVTGSQKDVKTLWDGMWTDDRLFNIGGRMYTLREMDDRRLFLITGHHRQDGDEEIYIDEVALAMRPDRQNIPLSIVKQLLTAFAERFTAHNNIRLYELLMGIGMRV